MVEKKKHGGHLKMLKTINEMISSFLINTLRTLRVSTITSVEDQFPHFKLNSVEEFYIPLYYTFSRGLLLSTL